MYENYATMNALTSLTIMSFLVLTGFGCTNRQQPAADMHTSQSSLDWEGTYAGMLPCADCEGIRTVVKLYRNNTYQLQLKYEGSEGVVQTSSGNFVWSDDGRNIVLDGGSEGRHFQVGENQLFWLDGEGKRITGPLDKNFILRKTENKITEKYWKLIELMGETVKTEGTREAYIILKQGGKVFNGHGGCNTIRGSYSLSEGDGITLGNIVTTKMACAAQATEQKFIQALQDAGSYLLKGDTLYLHKGPRAPLAKFTAVYLR